MQCSVASSSFYDHLELTFRHLTGEKIFHGCIESPVLFNLRVPHPGTKYLFKCISYVGYSKFSKCLHQVSEQVFFLTYGITCRNYKKLIHNFLDSTGVPYRTLCGCSAERLFGQRREFVPLVPTTWDEWSCADFSILPPWRFWMGNACCHSVKNLLSPRLLSRNVKTKSRKKYNFRLSVLCGCETWPLTLREQNRLMV
jgi:hypothetical protein